MREFEADPGHSGDNGMPRRLHPFALLTEAANAARALVIPALVGGASMGGGHMGRVVLWGVVLLAVFSVAFAVAEHLAFRYRVAADELILDSGVLNRRHRVIPLSRIQNLELRQTALQRAFDVAELRIETAGADTEEAVPLVLGRAEAELLRLELLRRGESPPDGTAEPAQARQQLARLSARDLVLAGVTANEAGVVAAVLIGIFEAAYQLPLGIPRIRLDPRVLIPNLPLFSTALLGLAILLVLFGFALLLSVGGALVGYWDFVLERAGGELRKGYGAFDRRDVTVPLARVQALRIEESLLRQPLGLASLKIETAGAAPGKAGRGGAEAFLPLVRVGEIARLAGAIFDGFDYGALAFHPVHPYAWRRAFFRYAALVLVLTAGMAVWRGPAAFWLLSLLVFAYMAAQGHYRALGYAHVPGYIVARSGFWTRITWIIPEPKVQTAHLTETFFQHRNAVATPVIDTAAAQVAISDLPRGHAMALFRNIAQRASIPVRQSAAGDGSVAEGHDGEEQAV